MPTFKKRITRRQVIKALKTEPLQAGAWISGAWESDDGKENLVKMIPTALCVRWELSFEV
jgi:hypothetical protein